MEEPLCHSPQDRAGAKPFGDLSFLVDQMGIIIPNNGRPVFLPGELCRSKEIKRVKALGKAQTLPWCREPVPWMAVSPRAGPAAALLGLPSAVDEREHCALLENRLELGKKRESGAKTFLSGRAERASWWDHLKEV